MIFRRKKKAKPEPASAKAKPSEKAVKTKPQAEKKPPKAPAVKESKVAQEEATPKKIKKTPEKIVEPPEDSKEAPAKKAKEIPAEAEKAPEEKIPPAEAPREEPPKEVPAAPEEVPKEAVPDLLGGEDELLTELAQKLHVKPSAAPIPAIGPTMGPAENHGGEVSAQAVAHEAPQPEAAPELTVSESIKTHLAETDGAITELAEKVATAEKARAPQEFYDYCTFEMPSGYQELERYWITKPFCWVTILYSSERNERVYHMVEPSLTPGEKTALELLHEHLLDRLSYDERIKDRDRALASKVNELLHEYGVSIGAKSIRKLLYYLKRNYIGYGRIDPFLHDPNIEDISCDGLNVPIFIYSRRYQSLRTNIVFTDTNELDLFVIRLVERAGKQISLGRPTIDASMREGFRLQATLGTEVTTRGSSFSIRKYAEEPFTPVDLLSYGTFSVDMLAYLWLATENKKNIVIVGGTASGKTSTLNAFSLFIWPDAKIVSIEDTRELALYQDNWIPSVTRPAPGERGIEMYDLLRQALRQRPEVIIMGEVRGKEALTMFQAMTTGHTCYSTMHAGSIQEMVHRLEGEPINVPHHMLASLDIVCLQLLTYFRDQRVRRNQTIIEVAGIDPASGSLRTNRVFERNPLTDVFERVGESQVLREIGKERGWSALDLERELRQRREVLQYLVKNNVRRLNEVAAVTRQYFFEPEKVVEQLTAGKLKM